jgi:uncharacterized membrane protein
MTKTNKLMSAAIAGLLGATMASSALAMDKSTSKSVDTEKCYGINACKGHGKCGGEGTSCAGTNSCKGKGWIDVIKGTCADINGGSLTPIKSAK